MAKVLPTRRRGRPPGQQASTSVGYENPAPSIPVNLATGDFVVVQLKGQRKQSATIYYIGVVLEWRDVPDVDVPGWIIKCMRRVSQNNPSQFTFPEKEDISLFSVSDVVARLTSPIIVGSRGVYHFSLLELYPFVISLH
jgi:hypothetical protein